MAIGEILAVQMARNCARVVVVYMNGFLLDDRISVFGGRIEKESPGVRLLYQGVIFFMLYLICKKNIYQQHYCMDVMIILSSQLIKVILLLMNHERQECE